MKAEIHNKTLATLKPKDKPYDVYDTKLSGFRLRVHPSGVMSYQLVYTRGKCLTIGTANKLDPKQARAIAEEQHAKYALGNDPAEQKRLKKVHADTYLDFLDQVYKPWLETNLRTGNETYRSLRSSFTELHPLRLDEISIVILEKWRSRRKKEGLKPGAIKRQLDDLKACLRRAVKWKALKAYPLDHLESESFDNKRVRYLSEKEESKLRVALDAREETILAGGTNHNPALKTAVLVSLNTGLRRKELFNLKWGNINFKQRLITVIAETAKTGKTRHIPLNEEALDILREWKDQQDNDLGYVFSNEKGQPLHDMDTSWNELLRKAKIHDFNWHDLRHSFASKLVMAGVDLYKVSKLLGHSNLKMTERYAHLNNEVLQGAVDKLTAVS